MPRGSNGLVSWPTGTTAGPPLTPISSSKFNIFLDDLKAILNGLLPVSRGGSGAGTAAAARGSFQVPVASTSALTDCNDATETGSYPIAGGASNSPSASALILDHRIFGLNQARQIAWEYATNKGWTRKISAAGGWSRWKPIWNGATAIGNVAMDLDGDPSGCLIQRALTESGGYQRFADGTQECWGATSIPGGLAGMPVPKTITFPIAFAAGTVPFIQVTAQTTSPGGTVQGVSYEPLDNVATQLFALRSDTSSTTVSWLAKGIWA